MREILTLFADNEEYKDLTLAGTGFIGRLGLSFFHCGSDWQTHEFPRRKYRPPLLE